MAIYFKITSFFCNSKNFEGFLIISECVKNPDCVISPDPTHVNSVSDVEYDSAFDFSINWKFRMQELFEKLEIL